MNIRDKKEEVKSLFLTIQKVAELRDESEGKQSKFLKLIKDANPQVESETRQINITMPKRIWDQVDDYAEKSSKIGEETEPSVEVDAICSFQIMSSPAFLSKPKPSSELIN